MPIDDNRLDQMTGARLNTPVAPVCPQCGYNLTGLSDALCPECGYRFQWVTVRRKARTLWLEALGLKTLPEEINFGFWLTCIGWAIALLVTGSLAMMRVFHILSFTLYTLFICLHLMQLLLAFFGVFLCAHILKFRNLSQEVREQLRIEVPAAKAWFGLIAGVVLLLMSLPMCLGIVLA